MVQLLKSHLTPALRITLHAAFVALFFFLFGVLMTWLYQSGTLWQMVRDKAGNIEAYMAAADISRTADQGTPDVLIIGDPVFLGEARTKLSNNFNIAQCRVDRLDFSDMPFCLKILDRLALDIPVVSPLLPLFFSTSTAYGSQPESWVLPGKSRSLFSLESVHNAFRLISLWAKAPSKRPETGQRPYLNELVTFTDHSHALAYYREARETLESLAGSRESLLYWVLDVEGIDYQAAPEFWREFSRNRNNLEQFLPAGQIVDWQYLNHTLKERQ